MVTLLRFVMAFALPPGAFVTCAAVVWGIALHRRRRQAARLAGLAAVILYACSAQWIGQALIHRLEYGYPAHARGATPADVIVVLGEGAVRGTKGIGGGSPSGSGANGLLAALVLHRSTGLPILLSGGRGDAAAGDESRIGRTILTGLGLPPGDVAVDERSQTTLQNARDTAAIMAGHGWCRALLIASAFHMATALRDFAWYGIPARPVPSGYETPRRLRPGLDDLAPTAAGLSMTETALEQDAELLLADARPLVQRRPRSVLAATCG